MNHTFAESMERTLNRLWERIVDFLPGLLAALLIILIGFVAAFIAARVVKWIFRAAKFDNLCEESGAARMLAKADIGGSPSELAGRILFWLIFLIFIMTGVGAMGLEVWNHLVEQFFLYLPRIFTAILILFGGFFFINFVGRAALLAAVNAGISSPRVFGSAVKFLLALLVFSMALEQLEIAKGVVTSAFTLAFGAFMLALALAFGLGGRDVARKLLERRFTENDEKPDDFSHL